MKTSKEQKSKICWDNKRRRKFYGEKIARRLSSYELNLPKEERGKWNNKVAYEYKPREDRKTNRFGEPLFELRLTTHSNEKIKRSFDEYYNHKTNTGNQRRWMRMEKCHSVIERFTDINTKQEIYKATYKCNDKLCANCSQIRSMIAITKYESKVLKMENPVMLVLHQESPKVGELKETIQAMYNDWRTIMKVNAKAGNPFNGICALEVTTNEDKQTFHPHYHIIIEKEQAENLLDEWIQIKHLRVKQNKKIAEKNKILLSENKPELPFHKVLVKLKDAHKNQITGLYYSEVPRTENGNVKIKELFKYAVKMSVSNKEKNNETLRTIGSTKMIYEIAKSLSGVQQWRPFGNFRQVAENKEAINKAIENEMTIQAIDYPMLNMCSRWTWDSKLHTWVSISRTWQLIQMTDAKRRDDNRFMRSKNENNISIDYSNRYELYSQENEKRKQKYLKKEESKEQDETRSKNFAEIDKWLLMEEEI